MLSWERQTTDADGAGAASDIAGVSPATLIDVARAVAHAESYWRPLVRHDSDMRWFVRLYGTEDVEAWLLTWTHEQAVELHDHGGSSGAVLVVEGTLEEAYSDRPP